MKYLQHIGSVFARKIEKRASLVSKKFWHNYPFGNAVRASKEEYMSLWEKETTNSYPEIGQLEARLGFELDKNWMDNLALHTQIVIKTSPLCYQHGRILYAALRKYLLDRESEEPLTIFETGTARGFSSIIMARALQDAKTSGKIITFDILPHNIPMFWNCIDDHEKPKSRKELLFPWSELASAYVLFMEGDSRINLSRLSADHIGFAFLDGAHGYNDVLFEFETVARKQRAGDVIVFDDYNEQDFPGLVKAVDYGCHVYGYNKDVIDSGKNRKYVIATRLKD
jgi:predicted O-methyltransferase YrrM